MPWPGKTRPGTASRSSRSASPGDSIPPPRTERATVTCRNRNGRRSRVCRESQPWRRACKEKAGRPRQEARPRRSSSLDGPGVIIDQAFHRGQPAAVVPGSRLVASTEPGHCQGEHDNQRHPSDPKSAKPASSAPSDRRMIGRAREARAEPVGPGSQEPRPPSEGRQASNRHLAATPEGWAGCHGSAVWIPWLAEAVSLRAAGLPLGAGCPQRGERRMR